MERWGSLVHTHKLLQQMILHQFYIINVLFMQTWVGQYFLTLEILLVLTTDDLTEGSTNKYVNNETVQDIVGAMVSSNTETDINVAYDDDNGKLDFTVSNISGNAGTATKLASAVTIGGVSFDGSANINLPGVNTTGDQDTSGNADPLLLLHLQLQEIFMV